ncbi:hypothetical protein F6P79_09710, partial [Streptococcus suis]|nr:hypothetical protein [Streptococcus suis]
YFVQIATILAKRRTIRPINRKRQTSSEMFVFILIKYFILITDVYLFVKKWAPHIDFVMQKIDFRSQGY